MESYQVYKKVEFVDVVPRGSAGDKVLLEIGYGWDPEKQSFSQIERIDVQEFFFEASDAPSVKLRITPGVIRFYAEPSPPSATGSIEVWIRSDHKYAWIRRQQK